MTKSIADESRMPPTRWDWAHQLPLNGQYSHRLQRRLTRAQKHGGGVRTILKRHRARGAKSL